MDFQRKSKNSTIKANEGGIFQKELWVKPLTHGANWKQSHKKLLKFLELHLKQSWATNLLWQDEKAALPPRKLILQYHLHMTPSRYQKEGTSQGQSQQPRKTLGWGASPREQNQGITCRLSHSKTTGPHSVCPVEFHHCYGPGTGSSHASPFCKGMFTEAILSPLLTVYCILDIWIQVTVLLVYRYPDPQDLHPDYRTIQDFDHDALTGCGSWVNSLGGHFVCRRDGSEHQWLRKYTVIDELFA